MIQALLTAYVVIKWVGEWSLLSEKMGEVFLSGLCFLALFTFVLSFLSPYKIRSLAALFDSEDRKFGVLVAPGIWILFFILYPQGLVDWLVSIHLLANNEGYLLSHQWPSGFDIFALILDLILFILLPLRRFFNINFGD